MASPSTSTDPSTDPSTDLEVGYLRLFRLDKPAPRSQHALLREAAALLTLWSLLVINEGTVRLINANPAAGLSLGRPPAALTFSSALAEVAFGLAGLFIGAAAFLRNAHSPKLTTFVMACQAVLSLYVFVIYVVVVPGVRAADLTESLLPGLSLGQSRFLIALGMLTSFHFCLALQGGQFMWMARLVSVGTSRDFLKQLSGTRARAVFWNGNMAAAGLWTFATGMLVRVNAGGRPDEPFVSPPNVGMLPGMTTWTSVVMMFWAAVGVIIALSRSAVPRFYWCGTAYVYVQTLLNYGVVQLGLIEGADAGDVAMHAGLVFVVVLLGPYFVQLGAREQQEGSVV